MTTAEKIKAIREKLGLSQQELAKLVGLNRASLSQIELGKRAVKSNELQDFAVVFECDPTELLGKEVPVETKSNSSSDSHYLLKQLILYIARKIDTRDNFGETLLNKLLYFADFNYYEWTGKLISDEKYIKMPYGPTPKGISDILQEMEHDGQIKRTTVQYHGHKQKKVIATVEPDMSIFEKLAKASQKHEDNYIPYEDLPSPTEVINNVLRKFGHRSATELSEWSHSDTPYEATEQVGDEIDPGLVFYRKEAFVANPHNLDDRDEG